jgi:signal transduction histidine kinase
MTGNFFLDWSTLALSLFNTILLIWLGLTVLFNAERRTGGIWLAGGGLLMGGAFFLSHSAILGLGPYNIGPGMNFWWRVGWIPVVSLPYAWYVVMLWYASYWDSPTAPIHRRHRIWLTLATLLASLTVGLIVFVNALPTITQLVNFSLDSLFSVNGIPVLMLLYPLYLLACLGLSLDVLLRPGISGRIMGHLARQRARPWLVIATIIMLLVSLLVGGVIWWVVQTIRQGLWVQEYITVVAQIAYVIAGFDLAIDLLIAVATLTVGQAVVSYEVFTGKTLPRHGLRRYWQRAIILAAGYGALVSWALVLPLRPIYTLLISTFLMTAFYGLLSWRSYAERESYIARLRPFVASQRLYDQLLEVPEQGEENLRPASSERKLVSEDIAQSFHALCADLIGTRLAYLVPLGPLAPLVGPGLAYPIDQQAHITSIIRQKLSNISSQPSTFILPLDPAEFAGCTWSVPLWSERGRIGLLLLSDKRDGGLYTQEEIEIARAVGERLIDTQASAELARRLMALQRQRLAESQVIDQRARRILHDDVLPRLHAAILTLSDGEALSKEPALPDKVTPRPAHPPENDVLQTLSDIHGRLAALLRELPTVTAPEVARLGLVEALRQTVNSEFAGAFDQIDWHIEPTAAQKAASIPVLTAEVIYYAAREAVRNAARHGRPANSTIPLRLEISAAWQDGLMIIVADNGAGIGSPPEDSLSANHGLHASHGPHASYGQGLALHSTLMAIVGGTLETESAPNIDALTQGQGGSNQEGYATEARFRVILSLPL